MRIDIVTGFPRLVRGPLNESILRQAKKKKLVTIRVHDLRKFTHDRHRTIDDSPYGGGAGMILKPEPIFECIESLRIRSWEERIAGGTEQAVILLSATNSLTRSSTPS